MTKISELQYHHILTEDNVLFEYQYIQLPAYIIEHVKHININNNVIPFDLLTSMNNEIKYDDYSMLKLPHSLISNTPLESNKHNLYVYLSLPLENNQHIKIVCKCIKSMLIIENKFLRRFEKINTNCTNHKILGVLIKITHLEKILILLDDKIFIDYDKMLIHEYVHKMNNYYYIPLNIDNIDILNVKKNDLSYDKLSINVLSYDKPIIYLDLI